MDKLAQTDHPILDIFAKRWSPRSFAGTLINQEDLHTLFEAARWAPSSGNGQPWFFIFSTKENVDQYQKIFNCLTDMNKRWAESAPVLILAIAKTIRRSGKKNRFAEYDLGQAVAHLTIQASSKNIFVHQMGGFSAAEARDAFSIPDGYEPMTIIALGYLGNPNDLPEDLKQREEAPRTRKDLNEFVFQQSWPRID